MTGEIHRNRDFSPNDKTVLFDDIIYWRDIRILVWKPAGVENIQAIRRRNLSRQWLLRLLLILNISI